MCREEGCCSTKQCSKAYLIFLNTLLMLSGFLFIVVSIWLGVDYGKYSQVITGAYIWAPLGCGLGLILVALLGCCGAITGNRISLFMYIFFSAILLLAATVLGIFLLVELGAIVEAGDVEDSNEVESQTVQDVTAFEAVLYNRCCSTFTTSQYTVGLCPCTTTTQEGCMCYHEAHLYDFLNADFDSDSEEDICESLGELSVIFDGQTIPLIGDPANGGCGSGDPKVFQQVLGVYAHDDLSPGAFAILGTGLALLVGFILACCIVCGRGHQKKEGYTEAGDQYDDDFGIDRPKEVELQEGENLTMA